MTRGIALVWGLGGVVLILGGAVVRLVPKVVAAYEHGLEPVHHAFAVGWLAFMLYTEGYRGFHQKFSPVCVARAQWLAQAGGALRLLLAPLFCMGFFHATRARLIKSWLLTLAIVGVVLVVHQLDQPWRGLVDLGVVAGLSYGSLTLLVIGARGSDADPCVPTA